MLASRNFIAAQGTVRYRLRKKKCSAIGMLAAAEPHNMNGARKLMVNLQIAGQGSKSKLGIRNKFEIQKENSNRIPFGH